MALQAQQRTVEAIRLLMNVKGLNTTTMAKAIRVPKSMTRQNLHAYLRVSEPQKITLDMLEDMARILDVPTWLLMQDRADVMKWLGENPEYGLRHGDDAQRPEWLDDRPRELVNSQP